VAMIQCGIDLEFQSSMGHPRARQAADGSPFSNGDRLSNERQPCAPGLERDNLIYWRAQKPPATPYTIQVFSLVFWARPVISSLLGIVVTARGQLS
jgi:hypothetical protein